MEITVCGQSAARVSDLIHALFDSAGRFYACGGYEALMDCRKGSHLYTFLSGLGYQNITEESCAEAASLPDVRKFTRMLSMLETIAGIGSPEAALVRDFYLRFGPAGILTYTKALVDSRKKPVYQPLTKAGTEILKQISQFRPCAVETIPGLEQAYAPLAALVYEMRVVLEDNPYRIVTGAYDRCDILCANLKGCFSFRIFGQTAPLGFEAWITSERGERI